MTVLPPQYAQGYIAVAPVAPGWGAGTSVALQPCSRPVPEGPWLPPGSVQMPVLLHHRGVSRKVKAPQPLLDLPPGLVGLILGFLSPSSASSTDAACRFLRDQNRGPGGAWEELGSREFAGLELHGTGQFARTTLPWRRCDWKTRFWTFRTSAPTFRTPFSGGQILGVSADDEIAYFNFRLRTGHLCASKSESLSAYVEVQILKNSDNIALAVVDFESGGASSLTFSPDSGAVLRERKVQETPRRTEGAYFQPLKTLIMENGFEGFMSFQIHQGQMAFFRKHDGSSVWETTGFVTDLSWAEGDHLTACLAFRNSGPYQVRIVRVGGDPPIEAFRNPLAYEQENWGSMNWDATEMD